MKSHIIIYILVALSALSACRNRDAGYQMSHEDKQAKEMMQGIWTNGESSDPAMLAKGDSIFYPDSASMPVRSGSIRTHSTCKESTLMDIR